MLAFSLFGHWLHRSSFVLVTAVLAVISAHATTLAAVDLKAPDPQTTPATTTKPATTTLQKSIKRVQIANPAATTAAPPADAQPKTAMAPVPITATITPNTIVVNTPTTVTVTARLNNQKLSGMLQLVQVTKSSGSDTSYKTLTRLTDAGNGVYTGQYPFNEPQPRVITLRVAGRVRQTQTVMMMSSNAGAGTAQSSDMTLTVKGQPPKSGWGEVLGNLLQGLSKSQPPPVNPRPKGTPVVTDDLSVRSPWPWQLDQGTNQSRHLAFLFCGDQGNCRWPRGGVLPPNWSAVDITTTNLGAATLEQAIQNDAGNVATEPTQVDGKPALRWRSIDDYGTWKEETVAVYVAQNGKLHKFFLTFRAGDELQSRFLDGFDQILSSVRFAE